MSTHSRRSTALPAFWPYSQRKRRYNGFIAGSKVFFFCDFHEGFIFVMMNAETAFRRPTVDFPVVKINFVDPTVQLCEI